MRKVGAGALGAAVSGVLIMASAAMADATAPQPRSRPVPPPAAMQIAEIAQKAPRPSAPTTIESLIKGVIKTAAPTPIQPPAVTTQPGGTTAFDATQRAIVERVNAYLSSLQTLVGNFVQVGPDGSRSQGEFYLQKPGKVRFEYDPPSVIQLISDGQAIVVRDRKLATQDVYPLSQTPLRFLLADRIDLLRDTNVVAVTADDVYATVTIEEKQTFGGTNRLRLMFGAKDYQLRQWTVTDSQGYDTTVAIYNLDTKKKPDPSMFKIDYTRYN